MAFLRPLRKRHSMLSETMLDDIMANEEIWYVSSSGNAWIISYYDLIDRQQRKTL